MSENTFVTSQSWISRLGGSIKGIFFGILMIIGAMILLWWNEGRAVKTAKGLDQGLEEVIQVQEGKALPENNGKLVYVSGKVETTDTLTDELFGIKERVLRLKRNVEMYQWSEYSESKKRKKIGGGEETTVTYKYKRIWSPSLINSSNFKTIEGHQNPGTMPFANYDNIAATASLGDFNLPNSLKNRLNTFEVQSINKLDTIALPNGKIINDGVNSYAYIGQGALGAPSVGDIKVDFKTVPMGNYSIVSKQLGKTFEAFTTNTNTSINLIDAGTVSSENMFQSAIQSNKIMTWILRIIGFFLIYGGFSMILKPLVIIGDLIPFVGSIINFGTSIVSGLIAFSVSLTVIAIAWIFYRPILGVSLLVIAAGVGYYLFKKAKEKKTPNPSI